MASSSPLIGTKRSSARPEFFAERREKRLPLFRLAHHPRPWRSRSVSCPPAGGAGGEGGGFSGAVGSRGGWVKKGLLPPSRPRGGGPRVTRTGRRRETQRT